MSSCTSTTFGECPSAGGTPSTGTAPRATSASTPTRRSARSSAQTTTVDSASSVRPLRLIPAPIFRGACPPALTDASSPPSRLRSRRPQARPAPASTSGASPASCTSPGSVRWARNVPVGSKSSSPAPRNAVVSILTRPLPSPSWRAPARSLVSPRRSPTIPQSLPRCGTSARRLQDTVGTRTSTAAAVAGASRGPTRQARADLGGFLVRGETWRTLCATRCVPPPEPGLLACHPRPRCS